MLGIQAVQVATANDDTIKFNPCFFLPHSKRLLQRYPLNNIICRPRTLRSPTPTLENVLKNKRRRVSSDPEEDLSHAKHELEWKLKNRRLSKNSWYSHATRVYHHIQEHVSPLRKGPTKLLALTDLAGQEYWL
jgi:hypothetical protein